MRPVNYETKNSFVNFSVWSERLRRAGALPAGVALAVLFALSAPSAQAKVEKITIAAIDDVVAGNEGWIIAIDDVAADAGGWITAIDEAAGAGGGVAAYAAGAGGGFAAFGDITGEIGGGIAAFGQIEARLFDENGKELFPDDFGIENKTTNKPDERTTDFPSNDNTPQITDDPVDETGIISFATSSTSLMEGGTANMKIHLSKPAPEGGIRFDITVGGRAVIDGDIEDPKSIFIPEGELVVTVPIATLDDADREDEIVSLYLFNGYQLPQGWQFSNNNLYHHLTIVDNDAPNPFEYPEDETPVAEKPDEDPAIDDTAIYPNGEPPSNENTPMITDDLTTAKPDDSNETEENALVDDEDEISHNKTARIAFRTIDEDEESVLLEGRDGVRMFVRKNPIFQDDIVIRDFAVTGGTAAPSGIRIRTNDNNSLPDDYELIKGVDVGIKAVSRDGWGDVRIINNVKISDVRIAIQAEVERGEDNIGISSRDEIWGVREYGIYAYHKGTGEINVRLAEDIKRIVSEDIDEKGDFSDVYMRGGREHNLNLKSGVILDNVTFGLDDDGRIESQWDVDSDDGKGQQNNFAGFVDEGAYRHILEHEVLEYTNGNRNKWTYYVELAPGAVAISNELMILAGIEVDGCPAYDSGFWAHQNSLRSSDDSVHFGFNTPALNFMGGGLVVSNSISPSLSASLVEGMSMSNSIVLDYHFDLMRFSVSPQMELAWTRFDFDDFTGPGSIGKVSLEDGDIVTGRLGLLFDGDYVYGGVNLRTAVDGKTSVNVSGVSISSEQDDLSFDGLLGFSYDWSEDYETYGELFMDADEVRANLGVRIDF